MDKKDRNRKYSLKWYYENKERVKNVKAKYYEDNKEEILEKQANYYLNNKEKKRASVRKHRYKLSEGQYNEMLEKQNNKCEICGRAPKNRALHVDHNHKTGKVRALLCNRCNIFVGYIEKGGLLNILKYLEQHNK